MTTKAEAHGDDIEPVNPRKFMALWGLEAHEATRVVPTSEESIKKNIAAAMDISEATAAELEDVCGKHSLFTGTEPKKKDSLYRMNEQPQGENLNCIKYQIVNNKRREEISLNIMAKMKMKYTRREPAILPKNSNAQVIESKFRVPVPNVILNVEITKCNRRGDYSLANKERGIFLVHGNQTLADLRDKIVCSSDKIIPGDYSSMPDVDTTQLQTLGDMYKSSFFFIDNVFYNDMRLEDNKDYSKPIIEWAKKHKPEVTYTTKEMCEQTFFDLDIRLGKYYLFTHQGNCEHSVMFTDLRLFNTNDLQDVRSYPMMINSTGTFRTFCQACYTQSSKWSVNESPLLPFEPTHLCRNCFKSILYTKDGQKSSNFKAYLYSM